jgi:hypothetical protein
MAENIAEVAITYARGAPGTPGKSPIIDPDTGIWCTWSDETQEYVSTGVAAQGEPGLDGTGSGGGTTVTLLEGDNISIDNTSPDTPVISVTDGSFVKPSFATHTSGYVIGDFTLAPGEPYNTQVVLTKRAIPVTPDAGVPKTYAFPINVQNLTLSYNATPGSEELTIHGPDVAQLEARIAHLEEQIETLLH